MFYYRDIQNILFSFLCSEIKLLHKLLLVFSLLLSEPWSLLYFSYIALSSVINVFWFLSLIYVFAVILFVTTWVVYGLGESPPIHHTSLLFVTSWVTEHINHSFSLFVNVWVIYETAHLSCAAPRSVISWKFRLVIYETAHLSWAAPRSV